jgi:chromosome segregation ATPase
MPNLLGGKVTFTVMAVLGAAAIGLFFWSMHLQSQNGAQKKEIQKLTEDLNLLQKEVEVKEASAKASEDSLNKMVQEQSALAAKHTQEKKDLETKLNALQDEAKNQKKVLEKLRADNKKLGGKIDQKKNELAALQAGLANAKPGTAAALKKQIADKEKELAELQKKAVEYDNQIEKIKSESASIDCLRMPVPQRILHELFGV